VEGDYGAVPQGEPGFPDLGYLRCPDRRQIALGPPVYVGYEAFIGAARPNEAVEDVSERMGQANP